MMTDDIEKWEKRNRIQTRLNFEINLKIIRQNSVHLIINKYLECVIDVILP